MIGIVVIFFPFDLATNGVPFGVKSVEELYLSRLELVPIVFTVFQLALQRTEFRLVPNHLEECTLLG